jgi:TPP-dependent trihydroxycyclohexane-1,2-dione (THcHDO) dehydratase
VTAKVKLTMAQALVRYLCAQYTEINGESQRLFNGLFAIFGHGNVAGLGEALQDIGGALPVYRGHNEQSMAHAAIAYAKTMRRQRMMACTTSVGPGATNMVTAAAVAHVNRLPVLLLPGETTGVALLGPNHPARTIAANASAGVVRTDRPGGVRASDSLLAAGRAGTGLRVS